MPAGHFLNALHATNRRLPMPDPGLWKTDEQFLRNYVDSVDVKEQLSADRMAHSIPSVYRRPIQFHQALSDESNPLHNATVDEWRGLMAVFCLGEWLGLEVKAVEFRVKEVEGAARSAVGNQNCGSLHLEAMLYHQRPRRALPEVERSRNGKKAAQEIVSDFNAWYMLRCGGSLLGATSPWTMVYTAAQYSCPPCIPWRERANGPGEPKFILVDPIRHYRQRCKNGRSLELAILYRWVSAIRENRTNWGFAADLGSFANLLSEQLERWQEDLQPFADNTLAELEPGEPLVPEAPYANVLRVPAGIRRWDSDRYLRGQVLVLQSGMPGDTRVFRGIFADRVDPATLDAEGKEFRTRDGILIAQPYIVPEKLFFPEKVVRLSLTEGALRRGTGSIPLTPAFFRYCSFSDLPGLSATVQNGDTLVTLRLNLEEGEQVTVRRVYHREDTVSLPGEPALALWPKEYDPLWTESYAAVAMPDLGLTVTPLFVDGSVREEKAGRDKNGKMRLWHLRRPAIGFALAVHDPANPAQDIAAGLVLRRALDEPRPIEPHHTWRVSVDFGTSSTTVMREDGNGRPIEMPFQGHLLSLVESAGTAGGHDEIVRNLYPQEPVITPFRTLLYETKNAEINVFGPEMPFLIRFASDAEKDLTYKPVPDLKWGMGARYRTDPLVEYLRALTRFIAWEARSNGVGTLRFLWSYPTSLPQAPLGKMRNFWRGLRLPHPGMSTADRNGKDDAAIDGIAESAAACWSLTRHSSDVAVGELSITVDVGGGSTDIAFWSEAKVLDHVSLKLAGNDMLDAAMLTAETLGEFLRICTGNAPSLDKLTELVGQADIQINGALSGMGKDQTDDPRHHPICDYVLQGGRSDSPPWRQFRSMIYLFYTGLVYYMGFNARAFDVTSPKVNIYFGGRGSAMLTWLSLRKEDIVGVLQTAFLAGLARADEDDVARKFPARAPVISIRGQAIAYDSRLPKLKREVAEGLLVDRPPTAADMTLEGAPAGERGWTRGKGGPRIGWLDRLSPADLGNATPPVEIGPDSMIGNYIFEVLHNHSATLEKLGLDKDGLKSLSLYGTDVQKFIIKSVGAGDNVAQPIFGFELKALMSKYANMNRGGGTETTQN